MFMVVVGHAFVSIVGMLVVMIVRMGMDHVPVTVLMFVMNHRNRRRATLAPATFTHTHLHIGISANISTRLEATFFKDKCKRQIDCTFLHEKCKHVQTTLPKPRHEKYNHLN